MTVGSFTVKGRAGSNTVRFPGALPRHKAHGPGHRPDNGSHFTYRFDIPAGVTGGKLTLEIGNEYLVSVSSDDQTYREVLRETNEEHDLNNLDPPHELELNTLLGGGRTLYVRIGDSFPQDGWGGWLGHLTLELTRD